MSPSNWIRPQNLGNTRKKQILCDSCVITALVRPEAQNEDVYREKGREGKLCYRQEIPVDIVSAVGKQTLRVSALKSWRAAEMPHVYAKYKHGLKAADRQPRSPCAKIPPCSKRPHREDGAGPCATPTRAGGKPETRAASHFSLSCALKILPIKKWNESQ